MMGNDRADDFLVSMMRTLTGDLFADDGTGSRLIGQIEDMMQSLEKASTEKARFRPSLNPRRPHTIITTSGEIVYEEVERVMHHSKTSYSDLVRGITVNETPALDVLVGLRTHQGTTWEVESASTSKLFANMSQILETGQSFFGKVVLVTGVGFGSIGAEVVRFLLMGGAHVIATTSREPALVAETFRQLYEDAGAKGSELRVVQFNQASANDCEQLVDYVYGTLGYDLDAILPFAAAPEPGTEIDEIGQKNELVHRLMLVNVHRLLGRIIKNKKDRGIDCHPPQVLLPLSPNHGTIGGDGLYSESKLGLESLLNRVQSESWEDHLSICGLKIGWTRSTALMRPNDIVAEAIEAHGVLTFSTHEMAFNIVTMMTPDLVEICEEQPILADFSGAMVALKNCSEVMSSARKSIQTAAYIKRTISTEHRKEMEVVNGPALKSNVPAILPKSLLRVGFPRIPDYDKDIKPLQSTERLVNLANHVVDIGLSELGPYGSARLR